MILYNSSTSCSLSLSSSLSHPHKPISSHKFIHYTAQAKPVKHAKPPSNPDFSDTANIQEWKKIGKRVAFSKHCDRFCSCGRRGFIGATLLPLLEQPSYAAALSPYTPTDPMNMLNRIHPPRPDWYEEFYASAMNSTMESYEAEIAGYKSQIFSDLRENNANKILELGIGTGPNLKYYASNGVDVIGVDPNQKMEKYAKVAAVSAGLPLEKFKFIRAVGEALPIEDASIDAVVGTLVLCSVKDVDATLQEVRRILKPGGAYLFVEHVAAKDGTILKFVQGILDPLQQAVADGCHLSRNTGSNDHEAVRYLLNLVHARKDAQGKIEVLEHLAGQSIASCLVEEFKVDEEKGIKLIDTFFFGLPKKIEVAVTVFEVLECINHDIRYIDDHARWFFQIMIENKLKALEDQLMDIAEGHRVDLSESLLSDLLLMLRRPIFSVIMRGYEFKFTVDCLHEFEIKDSDSESKNSMYLLLLEVLYRLPKEESTEKSFEDLMILNIDDMASLCPLFLEGENRWVLTLGFDYRSELAWYVVSRTSQIDDDVDPYPLMIYRRDILGSSRLELESATVDDLRKAIGVQFVDEMEFGDGVSRDWFTKLAKEIVESHEKSFDTCESDSRMIYLRKDDHEAVRYLLNLVHARKDAQGKIEVLEHLAGQSIASCLVEEFKVDEEKGIKLIDTFFFGLPKKIEVAVTVFEVLECINHDIRYIDDHARWFFQIMIENMLKALEDQLMDIAEGHMVDLSESLLSDLLLMLRRLIFSVIMRGYEFKFTVDCLHEFEIKDSDSESKKSMYLLLLEVLYRLPKEESTEKLFEDFMILNIDDMASLCPLFLEGENRWVLTLGFDYRSELAWYVVSRASQIDDDVDPYSLMIDRRDILGSSRMELESATVDDLRKAIGVQFVDEMGTGDGVSRDWFTKLAKEIVESHEKSFDTCESDSRMIYLRKEFKLDEQKGIKLIDTFFFGLPTIIEVAVMVFELLECINRDIRYIDESARSFFQIMIKNRLVALEDQLMEIGELRERGERNRVGLSESLLRDLLLMLRRSIFSFIMHGDEFEFTVDCLHEFKIEDSDSESEKSMCLLLLEVLYCLHKEESTEKLFKDFMNLDIVAMTSLCPLFLEGENRWVLDLRFDYRSKLAWFVVSMASQIDDDVDPYPLMIYRRDILGSSRLELESAIIDDLRKAIGVQFVDEMEFGDGVSRDWFTKLANEIVESHEKYFDTCESDSRMIYLRKGSSQQRRLTTTANSLRVAQDQRVPVEAKQKMVIEQVQERRVEIRHGTHDNRFEPKKTMHRRQKHPLPPNLKCTKPNILLLGVSLSSSLSFPL
ncbi:hypothetical protein POM88_038866 [Heracleum sosnowskyi]|uniref:Methyltransferase type 11 domain-containing protein n=1 Tax=Heracleum sosnowskyi TaxID=360622 RepID=A0AAD8H9C8_9APIA|nr:hypothetical protein POM88_038866 [Heracleum sosnowskyi]